jgi:hypothetical protein
MSQLLIVLDEAEDELIEAEKWYERQRLGLGREFRTEGIPGTQYQCFTMGAKTKLVLEA